MRTKERASEAAGCRQASAHVARCLRHDEHISGPRRDVGNEAAVHPNAGRRTDLRRAVGNCAPVDRVFAVQAKAAEQMRWPVEATLAATTTTLSPAPDKQPQTVDSLAARDQN